MLYEMRLLGREASDNDTLESVPRLIALREKCKKYDLGQEALDVTNDAIALMFDSVGTGDL